MSSYMSIPELSSESSFKSHDPVRSDEVGILEWNEYFLKTHKQLLDEHNANTLQTCRVLVLSGTDLRDTYEIDGEISTVMSDEELRNDDTYKKDKDKADMLEDSLKESNLTFKVMNISKYFHDFENMDEQDITKCKEKMIEAIQNAMPTLLVLPFQAVRFSDVENKGNIVEKMIESDAIDNSRKRKTEWDGMNGLIASDIVNELRNNGMWKEPMVATSKFLILKTLNMLETMKTLMTSNTTTNESGLRDSLPRILNRLKRLYGQEFITILFVSGGRGKDGESGFTRRKLLNKKFYEQMCKVLGVLTQDEPSPTIQSVHMDADRNALLKNRLYKKIRFNVLDIKHFHKEGEGDKEGLIEHVRALNPSAIIIDWSYSKNADVANVLTKSGIVAEMWLKCERTCIVGMSGKGWIDLDDKQTIALRDIIKHIDHLNGVILVGGHGTGTTLLACEVAKIKMAAWGENHEVFDFFCVDCSEFDNSVSNSSILNMFKNDVFVNEESANERYFYTLNKVEKESGIKKITSFKELLLTFQGMFEKRDKNNDRKKVLMLDEIPASFFFKNRSLNDAFDFEWNPNIFVVGCISPVIDKDESDFKEKLKDINKKSLLETNHILFSQLDVTYRNSFPIQIFYNVFLAHYSLLSKKGDQDILTGMMQQPQMDPNASDGMGSNLPSGPKPTFFIINKKLQELSDEELSIFETKVLKKIRGQDKSLSSMCIRGYGEECPFCRAINLKFQNKDDSTIKLFHKGGYRDSSGFRGCEQNNLILHIDDASGGAFVFEGFSRARQNLIVIISQTELKRNYPFQNTIKEMLTHEKKCKNQQCKENGSDKLKVVDVEYIGLKDEGIDGGLTDESSISEIDPQRIDPQSFEELIENTMKIGNLLAINEELIPNNLTKEQEKYLKNYAIKRQCLASISGGTPFHEGFMTSLPCFDTIENSVFMIWWEEEMLMNGKMVKEKKAGTGFFARVPDLGISIMSAGHNFECIFGENYGNSDFRRFTIHIGNISGDWIKNGELLRSPDDAQLVDSRQTLFQTLSNSFSNASIIHGLRSFTHRMSSYICNAGIVKRMQVAIQRMSSWVCNTNIVKQLPDSLNRIGNPIECSLDWYSAPEYHELEHWQSFCNNHIMQCLQVLCHRISSVICNSSILYSLRNSLYKVARGCCKWKRKRYGVMINFQVLLSQLKVSGSISYRGKRILLKHGNIVHFEEKLTDQTERLEDYCALIINDQDGLLEKLGITALYCGEDEYLAIAEGDLVGMFGHPGCDAFNDEGDEVRPLRLSFGTEHDPMNGNRDLDIKVKKMLEKCGLDSDIYRENHIFYDVDTLGGSSGSPVIGRGKHIDVTNKDYGYSVKSIHIGDCEAIDKMNVGQKMTKLKKWINLGRYFQNDGDRRRDIEGVSGIIDLR